MFDIHKHKNGDEGTSNLTLFNSSPIYSLTEGIGIYTVLMDNVVIAFIEITFFTCDYISIDLFEVLQKNQGIGYAIIDWIKSINEITRISINPLPKSIHFWEKSGFTQVSEEDWEWHRK